MVMIKFNCPACSKNIAVQDEHAGKKARCPQCKSIFTIPTLDSQEQSAEEKLPPQKGKDGPSPAYASATATPRGEKPPEGAKTNINRPNIDDEHKKPEGSSVMHPEPVNTPADNEKKAKSPSAAMGEKHRAQKLEGFAAADRHLFSATMDEKCEAQEPDEKNRALFSKAKNDSREARQIARQKKQRAVAIGVGAFILLLLVSCV